MKQFIATSLATWFENHSISAHTFVGLFGSFTMFLGFDASARDTVFGFLNQHRFYSLLFALASFAYARYSGSHSTQGQAAELIATASDSPGRVQAALNQANAQSPQTAPTISVTSPLQGKGQSS
jgi:hypothetical protein